MIPIPNSKDVNMKCICCGKKLKVFDESFNSPANKAAWDDCLVDAVEAGFGSKHDSITLLIGICDDCIDKKLADKSLIPVEDVNDVISKN